LARLSSPEKKRPDPDLLIYQLTRMVNTNYFPKTMAPKLRGDVVALYSALQSSDPIDSILDRLLVAALISVMECHARAASTTNQAALDVNLRHAEKGTKAVIELVEARARWRSPQKVLVGNVNVTAGGQAIVGNVETSKRRSKSEARSDSDPSRDDDDKDR